VRIRVPGDKSLTQRALIFSALARGESRLSGLLHGGDASSTAGAVRALGAELGPLPEDGSEVVVRSPGMRELAAPGEALDLGNSGTGTRLLLGALSGMPGQARVTGDASLRSRPMARVTVPLRAMGARFEGPDEGGRLPLTVHGTRPLSSLDWESPVASAQVKSSLLLAGVTGQAVVQLTEPRRSRDHTERLLHHLGASLVEHAVAGGWRVELREPPESLPAFRFRVPGDISSAAFFLTWAALSGGDSGPLDEEGLVVEGVGLNPTRTAFLDVLVRMGARAEVRDGRNEAGEPVGDVAVRPGPLQATTVGEDEIPGLIDELPLVAVLGTRAEGVTRITDATELRHKESDRIRALVDNLRALGVEVEERPDGLEVQGTSEPLSGAVRSFGDHRIAMAFGVLGALPGNDVRLDDPSVAAVSFPGFWSLLERVGRGDR